MVHFGLLHTFNKYEDVRKLTERLSEEKKITQPGDPKMARIDEEMQKLKAFRISYELTLADPFLARMLQHLYGVHI